MTAPLSWTAPAPTAAPPLVVRPDRPAARRWLTLILGLNGFLAVVCLLGALWAAGVTETWWGGAAFAITLVGSVTQMVLHSFSYGRLLGADVIAEVGPEGIRGPTTRWVQEAVPWASIATVTSGWNAVVVKTVDGRKLVIPARATTSDAHTIRSAVAHFSGGRL